MGGTIFITVEPDSVAQRPLQSIEIVVATGETAPRTFERFARAVGATPPESPSTLKEGAAMVWERRIASAPIAILPERGTKLGQRHRRKYAEAELPKGRSFYFRGPDRKLNLRAQNLKLFIQTAAGVDDETWLYHLHLEGTIRAG